MLNFTIPMKSPSLGNSRMHWAAKAKVVKSQRRAAMLKCKRWNLPPLLVVTLTRVSPRRLDDGDNLPAALKGFRDGIAARLGVDDGSGVVGWKYAQEQCSTGNECVRVEMQLTHISAYAPNGMCLDLEQNEHGPSDDGRHG
jgi:hypothetical protein